MPSPFIPAPMRVLELESSGADLESSGAVDLETKRGISTPERKWSAGTSKSPDSAAGTAWAGLQPSSLMHAVGHVVMLNAPE